MLMMLQNETDDDNKEKVPSGRLARNKTKHAKIANMHIEGMSKVKIAEKVGVTRQTIQKLLKTPEIRDYIDRAQKRIISTCLEPVIENIEYLTTNYKTTKTMTIKGEDVEVPVLDDKEKDHSFKTFSTVLEIAGVKPLPYQSSFIQNVYQDNKNVLILPVIEQALTKYVDSFKVIDVESEEVE